MATPPFNPDESKPGDSDIVSQFPAVERTFRDIVEDWINFEHDPSGHHAILRGGDVARDAITDWVVGSLWYNTDDTVLQIVDSIGPVVWVDVITGLGTAAFKNIGTSGDTIPKNDTANTFSADQVIQSTNAGATEGPAQELDRFSASPAAGDAGGVQRYTGRDDGASKVTYAKTGMTIDDPAAASKDAHWHVDTVIANTLARRVNVGAGVWTNNATGGDQGADSINASNYFVDGSALPFQKSYTSTEQVITLAGQLVLAHSLGAMPALIQCRLVCQTGELGYSAGDEVIVNPSTSTEGGSGGSANQGFSLVPDATNVTVRYGAGHTGSLTQIINKTTGNTDAITNVNWKLVVRAWA